MKSQPKKGYVSNDVVQTPALLAHSIVNHFSPSGKLLEPCKGQGNFLKYMPGADWCEISEGRDFLQYIQQVDWIITNPPWSKITLFLKHGMSIADNIVFLATVNHLWTESRIKAIQKAKFGIKEIVLLDWPDKSSGFPRMGFQLGAFHLKRGWKGKVAISRIKAS